MVSSYWELCFNLLNVDDSYLPNNNLGGLRGVRNNQGIFLAGFSSRMNFEASAQHIELLPIQAGLQFLKVRDISCAIVHSVCLLEIEAIHGISEDLSSLGNLVEDIKDLLHALQGISVSHASKTTNLVAHRLC